MRRVRHIVLATLAAAGLLTAGCGAEEELHVVEGEPLELGDLSYNVQITRFLNPEDPEDKAYLAGQEPPGPGQAYLGVFLTIENEGEEAVEIPSGFEVADTTGADYEPVPSESPYALQLPGQDETATQDAEPDAIEDLQPTEIPPGGEIPIPDSTAAEGVIGGAMLLFLVDESVTENRPLELHVPGEEEDGVVELDI